MRRSDKKTQLFELFLSAGGRVNARSVGNNNLLLGVALFRKNYALAELFLQYRAIVSLQLLNECKTESEIPEKLREALQARYDEQECCVCFENKNTLSDIPCNKKHPEWICEVCCKHINHNEKNNACPLCSGPLGKFGT
jgi:hypothetical protein